MLEKLVLADTGAQKFQKSSLRSSLTAYEEEEGGGGVSTELHWSGADSTSTHHLRRKLTLMLMDYWKTVTN